MKKIFTLLLCLASLGASAQQVNGGFDETWENCYPWAAGEKGSTAFGTTPKGWTISNVPEESVDILGSEVTDENGGKAVKITNKSNTILSSQKIPAYITLGTTWATAETRLTSIRNADGGAFGGVSFKYKPDGIRFKYQRSSADASQPASVIVYMWNGTWSQASVPSNTAVGLFGWGDATEVTMTDRDRNILGMTTATGGTTTSTNDAKLLFSFQGNITEDVSTWTTYEKYFDWGENENEDISNAKLNIIISANDYFGDRSAIVGDNSLTIDDVELIYNSSLSDLQFNGETISGFAKDTYEYTIDDGYTDGCITFTKDCVGGTVEGRFEPSSNSYIITVKGDDYKSNPSNTHTYTVKFTKVIINDGDDINEVGHISTGTVVLNRTFKAGWNTVCLPFPVTAARLGSSVTTYTLSTPSGDAITFSKTSSAIAKNTPFLANFPSEVNSITFTSRTIDEDKTPLVKTCGDWTFTGSYEPSISMEGKWGVVNDGSKVRKGGASSTLKSTRAYLEYNGTANVNEMRIIIDGEETTITEIDGMPVGNFDVYNLQGVRVRQNVNSLDGLNKGIYIVNGKKHIVK
ncbi:MAG: hypothetical protein IJZ01_01560 [Paraprevotella sp.]|nr:hypothetical protein [Paraprevotella sp.]